VIEYIEQSFDGHLLVHLLNGETVDLGSLPPREWYLRRTKGGGVPKPKAPSVDAGGPYTGFLGSPIGISGIVTQGAFPVSSTLWSIQSGPGGGTFGNPSALSTTFTPVAIGVYTLLLTATPTEGDSGSDVCSVRVFSAGETFYVLTEAGDKIILENSTDFVITEESP
jgi:hypothetical protein